MPPTHSDEGVRAAAAIRSELPRTGVVVPSQYAKESYAIQLLEESAAGVGYLLKDRVLEPGGFAKAVRQVAHGGSALDPEVVARMLGRRRRGGPLDQLSPRELDVLAGMAEGRSNVTIASDLGISEHALERDVAGIFINSNYPSAPKDIAECSPSSPTSARRRAEPHQYKQAPGRTVRAQAAP